MYFILKIHTMIENNINYAYIFSVYLKHIKLKFKAPKKLKTSYLEPGLHFEFPYMFYFLSSTI
jgi:hypothetical protein